MRVVVVGNGLVSAAVSWGLVQREPYTLTWCVEPEIQRESVAGLVLPDALTDDSTVTDFGTWVEGIPTAPPFERYPLRLKVRRRREWVDLPRPALMAGVIDVVAFERVLRAQAQALGATILAGAVDIEYLGDSDAIAGVRVDGQFVTGDRYLIASGVPFSPVRSLRVPLLREVEARTLRRFPLLQSRAWWEFRFPFATRTLATAPTVTSRRARRWGVVPFYGENWHVAPAGPQCLSVVALGSLGLSALPRLLRTLYAKL